jgi:hypothetical protein
MDFTGLVGKFPINRPLTDADRQYQLRQGVRLDVTPIDQLSVIRLNSTFLETVDKWYGWKGFTTAFAVTVLLMFFPAFGMLAFDYVLMLMGIEPTRSSTQELVFTLIFFGVLLTLIGWPMLLLLRKEKSHMRALGVPSDVSEMCLNHKLPFIEGIYDVHTYFEERKEALTRWANFLVAIDQGPEVGVPA